MFYLVFSLIRLQVDMRKVNLNVIRPWIVKKITELVGFEDEIVIEYAMGLLEDEQDRVCFSILSVTSFLLECSLPTRGRCKLS